MHSEKILSIFFSFFSFLLLFHQSQARSLVTSPSPAPGPGSNEGCWLLSNSCRNGTLTACIDPSSITSKQLLLFVKNDGESSLKVDVTVSRAKHIIKDWNMHIPGYQIKEANISANPGGISSIQLDAGNLGCIIRIESGGGFFDNIPFANHITPINGAYLVFLTGLVIVGGTWACCKQGNRGHPGNGIPYQGLKMEQPDSPSANNAETADGWEQDWDGDFDELKSMAAVGHQRANGSAKVHLTSRPPKRESRENTWED